MKKTLLYFFLIITICITAYARPSYYVSAGDGGGGDLLADGTVPLTADWDAGAFELRAESFYADAATTNYLIRFGDGDTGIKEVVDDVLDYYFGGAVSWRMRATIFGIQGSSGPLMQTSAGFSYTTPLFVIRGSDTDTGIAHGADGSFSLVADGVEGLRITTTGAVAAITFPSGYTRHIQLPVNVSTLGPTAPTATTTGTARGFGFDADAEQAFFNVEIPPDWDGISDMFLEIYWSPTSGDTILDTETVKWDISYRSITDGTAVDSGTAVDLTTTYTQAGAGTDKEFFETILTVDYDNVNQPLTADDTVFFILNRDVTADTYSGAGIVYRVELKYTANKMPYQ